MQFKIEFSADNASFDAAQFEARKMLGDVMAALYGGHECGIVKDSNGNRIGRWGFYEEEAN